MKSNINRKDKEQRANIKDLKLNPSKELLDALEEGEKIVQEVKEEKRKGYNNVNEMMKAILDQII